MRKIQPLLYLPSWVCNVDEVGMLKHAQKVFTVTHASWSHEDCVMCV